MVLVRPTLQIQTKARRRLRTNAPAAEDAVEDDERLVRAFVAGERDGFEKVVGRYEPFVRRMAWRLAGWRGDVDDVVQDVFLVALKKRKQFRGEAGLRTWLARIAINRCRTLARRRWLWDRFRVGVTVEHREATHAVESQEMDERVRRAVRALSERDREVIVLHYLNEMPVKLVAEILGAKVNAVEVRLHRARGRLKELLGELDG